MRHLLRVRFLITAAVFLFAALAFRNPIGDMIFAVRMALAVRNLAAGSETVTAPVIETKVRRDAGTRTLEAVFYRPSRGSPKRAVLLVPGISEQGCYHPRLQALSRALADKGFLVLTPDIREFRDFRIDPAGIDQIAFWFGQIRSLDGGSRIRTAGLGGISFSGTLALIAAARADIRDAVSYVLAIGPYFDIHKCTASWFEAGPRTVPDGQYPTRFYAKWIVMLAALDLIAADGERRFMDEVLRALLLQKQVPPPAPDLSAEGLRWYRLANMAEDEADPELADKIERHLSESLYRRLSPEPVLAGVRCPVYLAHGAFDDLIPQGESRELYRRLGPGRGHLLVTPFLTHTHPLDRPLSIAEKTRAAWDIVSFFYPLAGDVRRSE